MERVLEECEHVSADFSADPVHDLRVALRRCRSMADGMMAMDPDPDWKAMKKAGKRLFQRLGNLRDIQIMMEWIENLNVAGEPSSALPRAESFGGMAAVSSIQSGSLSDPSQALLQILRAREAEQKHEAGAALDEFDRKQWKQWGQSLPLRASRIRPGSAVFKHLALERWMAARDLHTRALRNRSQIALHALRIGIKRFRYIVENFLPEEHRAWSDDLKHMQDLLGDVHDLDVLWSTALSCHVFPDEASRKNWHARVVEERTKRTDEYRKNMVGENCLWSVWRAGLPQGKQIREIATRRMVLWAKTLDPDFAHSQRVVHLALEIYDGLVSTGLLATGFRASLPGTQPEKRNGNRADTRASLQVAALLHDVGKSKGEKGHHKESLELIKKHGTPLGWKEEEMHRAAIVARFHCGALPTRGHKVLRDLLPDEQKITIQLAAILRLANALDADHGGHIGRVKIENAISQSNDRGRRANGFWRKPLALGKNQALVIAAEGYEPSSPVARTVAAERYLLETVLRRPVVVRTMKTPPARSFSVTPPPGRSRVTT
jgi:CHAD domain-containing protein